MLFGAIMGLLSRECKKRLVPIATFAIAVLPAFGGLGGFSSTTIGGVF
jgi:hypothetical protein